MRRFILSKPNICQDRLGTNILGKTPKQIPVISLTGVMASHQSTNWLPMHANKRLLTLLREELGLGGGQQNAFFCATLIPKILVLPRQARDTHSETPAFFAGLVATDSNDIMALGAIGDGSYNDSCRRETLPLNQNKTQANVARQDCRSGAKNAHIFRANLYLKMISLPSQARDKHSENSTQRCVFRRLSPRR
jgi:hypothetical protein